MFFIRLGDASEDNVSCPSFLRPVLPEVSFLNDLKLGPKMVSYLKFLTEFVNTLKYIGLVGHVMFITNHTS